MIIDNKTAITKKTKENQTKRWAVKNIHWANKGIERTKHESPAITKNLGSLFIKSKRKTIINNKSCGLKSIYPVK